MQGRLSMPRVRTSNLSAEMYASVHVHQRRATYRTWSNASARTWSNASALLGMVEQCFSPYVEQCFSIARDGSHRGVLPVDNSGAPVLAARAAPPGTGSSARVYNADADRDVHRLRRAALRWCY
jgi:hypothetical protein